MNWPTKTYWPRMIAVKEGNSFELDDRLVIRHIEQDPDNGYFYIIVCDTDDTRPS